MPSRIQGVGVFAIKDIPKGTNPFIGSCQHKYLEFTQKELEELDFGVKNMVKDFCIFKNGKMLIPTCAFNGIDISYFPNHSTKPNLTVDAYGEIFITSRNITAGEELTFDYNASYGKGNL